MMNLTWRLLNIYVNQPTPMRQMLLDEYRGHSLLRRHCIIIHAHSPHEQRVQGEIRKSGDFS
jgi:hypothetical protein